MNPNHKFFCIEPYVSMSITEPGKVFCCCLHEGGKVTTPDDVWNDPYLKDIRAKFDRGEIPEECEGCVENEKHSDGRSSRRLDVNRNWLKLHNNYEDYIDSDAPYRFDFWVGNLCNLACNTCTSYYSSTWNTLLQRPAGHDRNHRNSIDIKEWKPITEDPPNIDYKNLEWIHFNGGEPLLTATHLKTLEKIPKEQRSSVRVEYNTNGTVKVDTNSEKYKIFKEFRSVTMTYSIDGIDDVFEEIRWPAKWNKVRDNIDNWVDQVCATKVSDNWFFMIGFNLTKSAYNYDSINETIDYIKERWTEPVKNYLIPEYKNWNYYDMIFLCNDHRSMNFTDKDFEEFTQTKEFIREKELIDRLRKR